MKAPGLYFHVPFCSAICPYCDFSVVQSQSPTRRRFVERLEAEVAQAARDWRGPRGFDTVYFGGGTPSQLSPEELERVLDACRAHLSLEAPVTDSISADRVAVALNRRGDCGAETDRLLVPPDPWIFLEANPEDVTAAACAAWRRLGVRTLSLGVQSFSDEALRFLGRHHSGQQARVAVETALAAGFDTVSLDLIYGLRGQTEEAWKAQLQAAVALNPQHLSCYQLTIHEGTRFGLQARQGRLSELPEDEQATLFELTHRFLADAGWPAYEVSNFARGDAHQSRHNRKYWDHTPYLGLGPSAHSFALSPVARRWWNERRTTQWERRLAVGERPIEEQETLGAKSLAEEALLLGLRTAAGVHLDDFKARYGFDLLAANEALVGRLVDEARLVLREDAHSGRRLIPTIAGLAIADGLAAAFALDVISSGR